MGLIEVACSNTELCGDDSTGIRRRQELARLLFARLPLRVAALLVSLSLLRDFFPVHQLLRERVPRLSRRQFAALYIGEGVGDDRRPAQPLRPLLERRRGP